MAMLMKKISVINIEKFTLGFDFKLRGRHKGKIGRAQLLGGNVEGKR